MRIDLSQLTPGQVLNEQNTKKVSDQQAGAPDASGSVDRTTFTSDSSFGQHSCGQGDEFARNPPGSGEPTQASGEQRAVQLDPNAIASSMIDEHA